MAIIIDKFKHVGLIDYNGSASLLFSKSMEMMALDSIVANATVHYSAEFNPFIGVSDGDNFDSQIVVPGNNGKELLLATPKQLLLNFYDAMNYGQTFEDFFAKTFHEGIVYIPDEYTSHRMVSRSLFEIEPLLKEYYNGEFPSHGYRTLDTNLS